MCSPALLTARYTEVLTEHLGLPTQIDTDTHLVRFAHRDVTFELTLLAPARPELLVLGVVGQIPTTHAAALHAAGRLNATTPMIKCTVAALTETRCAVRISLEQPVAMRGIMPSTRTLTVLLPSALTVLHEALDRAEEIFTQTAS